MAAVGEHIRKKREATSKKIMTLSFMVVFDDGALTRRGQSSLLEMFQKLDEIEDGIDKILAGMTKMTEETEG